MLRISFSARSLIGAAFQAGFLLGSLETLRVISTIPRLSGYEIVALLVYGGVGYAAVSAVLAAILFYSFRVRRLDAAGFPSAGIAIAASVFFSIRFLSELAIAGEPKLAWLVPGCVLMGMVCGMVVYWLTTRFKFLQSRLFWNAGSGLLLILNLFIALRTTANSYVPSAAAVASMPAERPNVVLISIDTLRRDRIGCYGYSGAKTPHIDTLASNGILFDDAVTPIAVTGPAHTTMLTGLYPIHHGATANGIPMRRRSFISVSEILSKAGYRTAGFISGWPLKHMPSGLAERFDSYDEDFAIWRGFPDVVLFLPLPQVLAEAAYALGFRIDRLERTGAETTTRAIEWLNRNGDRPFFMFVHYFDPHGPHLPLKDSQSSRPAGRDRLLFTYSTSPADQQQILSSSDDVKYIESLYDEEISYTDRQVGRLTAALSSLNLEEKTLVIFTADHGESLTEHNYYFGHGEFLYETCVRVPLIMRFPKMFSSHSVVREQVGLIDLTPTILDLLNINSATRFDGKSLLPLIERTDLQPRTAFGSVYAGRSIDSRSRYYVRKNGYKLIWNFDRREKFQDKPAYEELYDLKSDPSELYNVIGTSPAYLEDLRKELSDWIKQKPGVRIPENEEILDRLRALGYVGK